MSETEQPNRTHSDVENPYEATPIAAPVIASIKVPGLSHVFWLNASLVTILLFAGVFFLDTYTFGFFLLLQIPVVCRVWSVHRNFVRAGRSSFRAVGSYYWSWFLAAVMLPTAGFAFLATCTVSMMAMEMSPMSSDWNVATGIAGCVALASFLGLYYLTFRMQF